VPNRTPFRTCLERFRKWRVSLMIKGFFQQF
jgi:hypothetical protein